MMILYKYVPEETLKLFFDHDATSFKFTPVGQFNDPFETYGVSFASEDEDSLAHLTFRSKINSDLASLCLSRSPLEVLMWSHYAQHHRGYVVGIDTELAGFHDENLCLITANEGGIDYLDERDKSRVIISDKNFKNKDIVKKVLFRKSQHWKYEKEVRIVIESDKLIPIGDDEEDRFYIYKAPCTNIIKEIFIGINNEDFELRALENDNLRNGILDNNIKIQKCCFKRGTWDLDKTDYDMSLLTDWPSADFGILAGVISAFEKNEI
ncbi:DUF2971 domain-containing protein [Enterobacter hormaechei]|uniref:DUF2971 domain-containing protein n=1 Tax=Enterobacter hormaechei TaxID=158836 RepID=UPI00406910BB